MSNVVSPRGAARSLEGRFRAWMEACRTARPGAHWLVAVSGGGDSVALLRLLGPEADRRNMRLTVAHLHHGIRGRAADADARFVHDLAAARHCPVVLAWEDAPAHARARKESLEMAARALRRAFLADAAREAGADAIVLGHTADDQAETLVLRLARGCGLDGLAGMRTEDRLDGIPLLRPLLGERRGELRRYLRAIGQPWREDATNRAGEARRNRVRRRVLPLLERELNPRVVAALARVAAQLQGERDWWRAAAERAWPRVVRNRNGRMRLDVGAWRRLPAPLRDRLMRSLLRIAGVPEERMTQKLLAKINEQIRCEAPASLTLPGKRCGRRLTGRRTEWEVGPQGPVVPSGSRRRSVRLAAPGRTPLPAWGLTAVVERRRGYDTAREPGLGRWPTETALTAAGGDRTLGLAVRGARPGDAYQPLGAPGRRKLQDIFTEERWPRDRRVGYPVVVRGRELVWLPGYRLSQAWRVTSTSAPSWKIRFEPAVEELRKRG